MSLSAIFKCVQKMFCVDDVVLLHISLSIVKYLCGNRNSDKCVSDSCFYFLCVVEVTAKVHRVGKVIGTRTFNQAIRYSKVCGACAFFEGVCK